MLEDSDRMEKLKMDMAEALRSYLDESPLYVAYNISWLRKRGWCWSDRNLCWIQLSVATDTPTEGE